MKKIIIEPGCIGCGLCASIAPDVFDVKNISRVKEDINVKDYEASIKKAIESCPIQVITVEK